MTARIFDTVMGNAEFDMLECRLTELECIPNLITVVVEADVDHQGHSKPYWFSENLGRFEPWLDRVYVVRAKGLPTATEDPDPWAREHAQREYTWAALRHFDAQPDDVVLHGDLDEIPTALAARNVKPRRFVAFEQRFHCFAVDWLHPDIWRGTVAAPAGKIDSFGAMRDARNWAPSIPNAGWHFSWVGGQQYALDKLGSFCHPEIADRTLHGLESDWFYTDGYHVDGRRLEPVTVDRRWPRWIYEGHCPDVWFRPKGPRQERPIVGGPVLGAGVRQ